MLQLRIKNINNKEVTFKPVITVMKRLATVTNSAITSGSAVTVRNSVLKPNAESVIEKLDTGNYVIALYAANDTYYSRPIKTVSL